jgi:hypothetical protein
MEERCQPAMKAYGAERKLCHPDEGGISAPWGASSRSAEIPRSRSE